MNSTTLNSALTDAELCRRNGWGPGTRLIGTQGSTTVTMTVTAIGDDLILAKLDGWSEMIWTLKDRDWKVLK